MSFNLNPSAKKNKPEHLACAPGMFHYWGLFRMFTPIFTGECRISGPFLALENLILNDLHFSSPGTCRCP